MNRQSSMVLAVLMTVVLPSMGAVTNWLDTLHPEQFVSVMDNPDGTYTATWKTDEYTKDH